MIEARSPSPAVGSCFNGAQSWPGSNQQILAYQEPYYYVQQQQQMPYYGGVDVAAYGVDPASWQHAFANALYAQPYYAAQPSAVPKQNPPPPPTRPPPAKPKPPPLKNAGPKPPQGSPKNVGSPLGKRRTSVTEAMTAATTRPPKPEDRRTVAGKGFDGFGFR